jgi:hypothetical protein
MVNIFTTKHVRKTLASILSKKAAAVRRMRECKSHTATSEAKKKKNEKSVQNFMALSGSSSNQ